MSPSEVSERARRFPAGLQHHCPPIRLKASAGQEDGAAFEDGVPSSQTTMPPPPVLLAVPEDF